MPAKKIRARKAVRVDFLTRVFTALNFFRPRPESSGLPRLRFRFDVAEDAEVDGVDDVVGPELPVPFGP